MSLTIIKLKEFFFFLFLSGKMMVEGNLYNVGISELTFIGKFNPLLMVNKNEHEKLERQAAWHAKPLKLPRNWFPLLINFRIKYFPTSPPSSRNPTKLNLRNLYFSVNRRKCSLFCVSATYNQHKPLTIRGLKNKQQILVIPLVKVMMRIIRALSLRCKFCSCCEVLYVFCTKFILPLQSCTGASLYPE